MNVQRVSGNRGAGVGSDNETWTESITAIGALSEGSIMGECATIDTGSNDGHDGLVNFEFTSTSVVTLGRGNNKEEREYRFEAVEWPTESAGGTVHELMTSRCTRAASQTRHSAL